MDKTIKVLHFSTHNENCGIGKYQEMFLDAMKPLGTIENSFFAVSPNKIRIMSSEEKAQVFKDLVTELEAYDILHIQHEFSFYPSDEFLLACQAAQKAHKKLVVTVHTSPNVAFMPARFAGYSFRSLLHYARARKRQSFFERTFVSPLRTANIVLVHNDVTKAALTALGVQEQIIGSITIPVPSIDSKTVSQEINQHLAVQPGDIVYGTTGFLHQYKGIDHAIKALSFLPQNYKLAIVGGMHQDHDHQIYNTLTDLIQELGLINRVYITGYVADDTRLNALIRECHICIYPYEKVYYSNVSSAALNNAFANSKPVIAYPTESFKQINKDHDYMKLTQAFSYYELAREINRLDNIKATQQSIHYAKKYSYPEVAKQLVQIYHDV